jgi:hypothetical protein
METEPWVCVDCGHDAPLAPGIGYFCVNDDCPEGRPGLANFLRRGEDPLAVRFCPRSEWEARRKLIAAAESLLE